MRVRRVYIKKAGGEIATEACYTAWRGFSHKGYPVDFFEWDELLHKSLPLDRFTLVVGGTVAVHKALRQIGVQVPGPLNLPRPLLSFAGRQIWETTLGAVRREVNAGQAVPTFIKPLAETKSFPGCVIDGGPELRRLQHLDDELPLQAAEVVPFVAEWRFFVSRATVVGLALYKGEWSVVPDSATVRQAVAAYSAAPVAYSLDFGVTVDGRTLLVEANDAFALGAYGLDAAVYATMLEDRWLELVGAEGATKTIAGAGDGG
jgi:hypothetical protein